MAAVVFVHGIRQQVKGNETLHAEIAPSLVDGVGLAGGTLRASDVACAFYGDLFRPAGEYLAPAPVIGAEDLTGQEVELLLEWWRRAAELDPAIASPDVEVLARSPRVVNAAIRALSRSRYFSGLAERLLIGSARQVRRYLDEPAIRTEAVRRVLDAMSTDTKVVVAHSLGSVVAYEALARTRAAVDLVTLGSPLGLRHAIFNRLEPTPPGCWPGAVRCWTNVVDKGDVVAAVEDLRPLFSDRVEQVRIHNGAKAHDAKPYLADRLTGRAIARGLDA